VVELPAPGSWIAGRYRVESLLGQGGMGAVFAATDTTTGRAVALKWLSPSTADSADAVLRFLAEARATAKIEHPNVVAVIDMGREGQAPFLVMERLRGESLGARLDRGRLDVVSALDIVIPACRGVAEAHREGVIHRDLKPDNIFLCKSRDGPVPKVVDFGVAKLRGGLQLTKTGVMIGTIRYMAPEQMGKAREAEPTVDVYSMGAVLYEALTGRPAYDAREVLVLMRQVAEGNPTPVRAFAPDVPPELDAIVLRAMHVDRNARFRTMDELVAALESVRRRYGRMPPPRAPRSRPPTRPRVPHSQTYIPSVQPPPRGSRRRMLLIGAASGAIAFFVIAAIGIGVFVRRQSSQASAVSSSTLSGDRAQIDVRTGGDCAVNFDAPVSVRPRFGVEGVWIHSESAPLISDLTIVSTYPPQLGQWIDLRVEGSLTLSITSTTPRGQRVWNSRFSDRGISRSLSGWVRIDRWEPGGRGFDIRFRGVRLTEGSSTPHCRLSGRIQTFGSSAR
jgi:serine/threonine-protein kinase